MSIQINIPDHILYEDEYIIVLVKPCSLMVEPDRNGYPNLLQQVRKYLKLSVAKGTDVYVQHIHRLDRPASGIILFAKLKAVLKNLSEQFAERKVKKFYQALTESAPEQKKGMLEHWHQKKDKKAVIYEKEIQGAEKVIFNYTVTPLSENRFIWDIELHTGKYHQIRAQLSAIGCPIIGDTLYNSSVPYKPDSIALHAYKLVFSHPVTNEVLTMEKRTRF